MESFDNQAFNNACDFIKKTEGISFTALVDDMGWDKVEFNNIRTNKKQIPMKMISALVAAFPQTSRFFKEQKKGMTLEDCLQKLIDKYESEIALLRENSQLKEKVIRLENKLNTKAQE